MSKKNKYDNEQDTLTTEDILQSLSTERVTIDPNYLKAQAKKDIDAFLVAMYSGNESLLPEHNMADEFYKLSYDSIMREHNNNIKRTLYQFNIKDVKPTKLDDSLMYLVTSVEFEVHFTIKFSIVHVTFQQAEEKELKIRYLFTNGTNIKNKGNWLLEKETYRKELSSTPFNLDDVNPQDKRFAQPLPQNPMQGFQGQNNMGRPMQGGYRPNQGYMPPNGPQGYQGQGGMNYPPQGGYPPNQGYMPQNPMQGYPMQNNMGTTNLQSNPCSFNGQLEQEPLDSGNSNLFQHLKEPIEEQQSTQIEPNVEIKEATIDSSQELVLNNIPIQNKTLELETNIEQNNNDNDNSQIDDVSQKSQIRRNRRKSDDELLKELEDDVEV